VRVSSGVVHFFRDLAATCQRLNLKVKSENSKTQNGRISFHGFKSVVSGSVGRVLILFFRGGNKPRGIFKIALLHIKKQRTAIYNLTSRRGCVSKCTLLYRAINFKDTVSCKLSVFTLNRCAFLSHVCLQVDRKSLQ